MSVGTADPEGSHPGAARSAGAPPFAQFCIDEKGRTCEVDQRIRLVEVETRWQLLMFEREHGLDKACNTGRGVEMPNIGFNRADRAKTLCLSILTKDLA
jgi:hypothetical protein